MIKNMKLIGSKTEQQFREELLKSNEFLFTSDEGKTILDVLRKSNNLVETAYILDWIPEQGENLYTILINGNLIAEIEISRENFIEPIISFRKTSQYLRGLSKINQIKLAVALDLSQKP